MAYTLDNKCAKNCCKRTILVQLIVEDVVTCFLKHSVVGELNAFNNSQLLKLLTEYTTVVDSHVLPQNIGLQGRLIFGEMTHAAS